jgi:hypothetical protein
MPARKDAAGELAQKMIRCLEQQRGLPSKQNPFTLRRLAEVADPQASPALISKAANKREFQTRVLLVSRKDLDTPVALADDADVLVGSRRLLDFLLQKARTPTNQAFSAAQLKAKAASKVQKAIQLALARQLEQGTLPPGVGWITINRSRKLFLLSDVQTGKPVAAPVAPPPVDSQGEKFDQAFIKLDHESGGHNLVSLVGLRRAMGLNRENFDHLLHDLRRSGKYSLSAAEGRHGIGPEDQAAGIEEGNSLLLYVSRREG